MSETKHLRTWYWLSEGVMTHWSDGSTLLLSWRDLEFLARLLSKRKDP